MELDVSAVCRVCLQECEEMISIYEKDTEENLFLYEKIEKCGSIKLINEPGLPSNICTKCHLFLTFAYKFHIICRKSNQYLREFDNNDELEFEETEYLMDYNPVDDYQGEYYELHDDVGDDHDVVSSSKTRKPLPPQQKLQNKRPRRPVKTLDISSDGAAVIRVNNAKVLERELKKNQSHICDVCGNVYPKKYALEAHMKRHRNERPFECEICQQRFTFNFQLTRHILKHTGARPYNCVYCQRSFTDRSTMKKHERLHRNERPYKCDTCNKTFTYSSVLKVHKLTHTGEKPFNCGICGKRFARAHHLRAHLETLLHSKDPQAKVLLKQMRREEGIFEEDA